MDTTVRQAGKMIASVLGVVQILCFVGYIIIGFYMLGWLIHWWDQLVWSLVATILAFLTVSVFPLIILIEWIWHGFPKDIGMALILGVALMGAFGATYWLKRFFNPALEEDVL